MMARIDGAHRLVVDAELLHRSRPIILDNHVRRLGEAEERLASGLAFEVEGDRALVAVHVEETEAVVALELEPHGAAGLIALRRLDLDDVRPEVGQKHAAERARHDLADIEHPDGLKRQRLPGAASGLG